MSGLNNAFTRSFSGGLCKVLSKQGHIPPSSRTISSLKNVPFAKYGGRHTVTMMPGSGIGPEMMEHVRETFKVAGAPVDFEMVHLDANTENYDDLHNAISSVMRNGCGIKANIETKDNLPNIKSRNVEMRNQLDLYANILHCYSRPGVITRHDNIDVVLVRQNTEGEYAMLEHENVQGVVESLKVITADNTRRLVTYAFEYAITNNRKKVTLVHKANIMKLTDGLFLKVAADVARDYPNIEFNDMIVDNCCMQLVSNPWQFDVMVLTNLYGTIVSNLLCGLIGGPGITAGSNYGPQYALFEPGTRNTGTSLVSQNSANPIAMLTAGVELLKHLELNKHADIIQTSIDTVLNVEKIHTPDLGGNAETSDVVEAILRNIRSLTH